MAYLALACGAVLGVLFAVSSVSKLRGSDFSSFVASLRRLPVVPAGWESPTAMAVVGAEVSISLLLAVPKTVVVGFIFAGRVHCRNFHQSGQEHTGSLPVLWPRRKPLSFRHVACDGFLITLAVLGCVAAAAATDSDPHPAGVVVDMVAAGCIALLLIRFDDLADLFASPRNLAPGPAHGPKRRFGEEIAR